MGDLIFPSFKFMNIFEKYLHKWSVSLLYNKRKSNDSPKDISVTDYIFVIRLNAYKFSVDF